VWDSRVAPFPDFTGAGKTSAKDSPVKIETFQNVLLRLISATQAAGWRREVGRRYCADKRM